MVKRRCDLKQRQAMGMKPGGFGGDHRRLTAKFGLVARSVVVGQGCPTFEKLQDEGTGALKAIDFSAKALDDFFVESYWAITSC